MSFSFFDWDKGMQQVISFLSQIDPAAKDVLFDRGVLGVVVFFLTGALVYLFRIVLKDRDKAIAQRDELLETFFTKVLPAITKNTEVLEKRQELDKELILTAKESSDATKENNELLKQVKYLIELGRQ